MHGLGNDFVVIDAIRQQISLTPEQIRFIANRHFGVGCDQLLLVENAQHSDADFCYRIFNADGSEVAQCGNGARCFARFVRDKKLSCKDNILVDTHAGQLLLTFDDDGLITVNMGVPRHKPALIPLKTEQEEEAKQEVAPMPETGLKEHIEAKKQEESINKEQAKTEAVEAETVEPEKEKETEPKTEPEVKKTRKSKKKPEEPMVDYLSVIVKAVQDKVIENNENNVSKEDFESLLMLLEHQANTTLKFVSNYTSKG